MSRGRRVAAPTPGQLQIPVRLFDRVCAIYGLPEMPVIVADAIAAQIDALPDAAPEWTPPADSYGCVAPPFAKCFIEATTRHEAHTMKVPGSAPISVPAGTTQRGVACYDVSAGEMRERVVAPDMQQVEASAPAAPREPPKNPPVTQASRPNTVPQLRAGERKMLEVVARHPTGRVTRAQLATLAGFAPTGGTFGTYFGTLKRAGLIGESDGMVQITAAGMRYLGADAPLKPQTTQEILAMWAPALRAGERAMLELLVGVYPQTRSRAWLAFQAGYELSGGTFGTYLGTLRRNGLIEVQGDAVRASPTLFQGHQP